MEALGNNKGLPFPQGLMLSSPKNAQASVAAEYLR
jgi:hypothetical protein